MPSSLNARQLAARLGQLRGLPAPVALFQARALVLALRLHDEFALTSATRPADVARLLSLAAGRRQIVELGTATGWTAASLVLADRRCRVTSFDPVVQPRRERYLSLLRRPARTRLDLVTKPGVSGAALPGPDIDMLFIDSTHRRDDTMAEFRAWRPRLSPGAIVVFHDFENPAFPGVAEAVAALGLEGQATGGSYLWERPAPNPKPPPGPLRGQPRGITSMRR